MHLRVIVNGTIDQVKKWKNDLASIWLSYEQVKGQPKGAFQLGVRTIEMIDLCFPEDQLDNVLQIVKPVTSMYATKDCKHKRYPWLERFIKWSRKAMNLLPVPETEYKPNLMDKEQVAVHGVGIKQDLYDDNGIELL